MSGISAADLDEIKFSFSPSVPKAFSISLFLCMDALVAARTDPNDPLYFDQDPAPLLEIGN